MVFKLYASVTVLLVFGVTSCVSDTKRNVAFVIDDTGSMDVVIDQVKDKAKHIFESIYASSTSLIGDFILVTFKDYEVLDKGKYYDDFTLKAIQLRITTNDSSLFKKQLEGISCWGGGQCPELCMGGIKMAIENSKPNSFVYVFTDASARDYELNKTIIALAQQKSIQITFLLTPSLCPDFDVYEQIAKATSGLVFKLFQDNIKEIIEYIIHSMLNPQTPLLTAPILPGTNNYNFTVDSDMKNVSIVVHVNPGAAVGLNVTGPKGNKIQPNYLVNISYIKVLIIPNPESGLYTMMVDTDGKGETSIKSYTTVGFEHGFSVWQPSSIDNTRTRPVPDQESYLAIQLQFMGTNNATLRNIQILDINDKELMSLPARIVDEKHNFYVTAPFKPPDQTFKIVILAADPKTGDIFKRLAQTPIEEQTIPAGKLDYKRPEVTIEGRPKFIAKYGETIILECKVKAYPKPNIIWKDKDAGLQLPSTVSLLELPDEYISHLKINNISKYGSYKCEATSNRDEVATASIDVETYRPRFLKVLESPKDTKINYEKDAKIHCKIDSWPIGLVSWYKDDKQLTKGINFDISDDRSTLLVKRMRPELEGHYVCKATNDDSFLILNFTLSVSGVEAPEIDKSHPTSTVTENSKAYVLCRITKGIPMPMTTWEFKKHDANEFVGLAIREQKIKLDPVEMSSAGIYKCHAKNILGEDYHETLLIVQCKPEIDKRLSNVVANQGSKIIISCRILKGNPQPLITWEFKRQRATEFVELLEKESEYHIDTVTPDNAGVYKCHAKNAAGEDTHKTELTVHYTPTVTVNPPITVKVDDTVTLTCDVTGEPKPDVRWIRHGKTIESNRKYKIYSDHSLRFIAGVRDGGIYTCEAKNTAGSKSQGAILELYGPIKIEPPKETPLNVDVGSDVVLLCKARGIPTPSITWKFFSLQPSVEPEILSSTEVLTINKIQATDTGYYTCVANNGHEEKTITYKVLVHVPVKIATPVHKEFNIVEDDLVLRIPCEAIGYPKPTVTWTMLYGVLPMGDQYATDSDGTLIIKNPDSSMSGKYMCIVDNGETHAFQLFTVNVTSTPDSHEPTDTIYIEEGTTTEIKCRLPHKSIDVVRWYTRGTEIKLTGNRFILRDASISASADYTCRVSSFQGSQTAHLRIKVGNKPFFLYNIKKKTIVPFISGRHIVLDCSVGGIPLPMVTWWRNGRKLNETNNQYSINSVNETHLGENRCEAKNQYGIISRTYLFKITGCKINYAETESNRFHPILISSSRKLAQFENQDGVMIVPENEEIEFLCPHGTRQARCSNNEFTLTYESAKPRRFKYSELKCNSEVKLNIKKYIMPSDVGCTANIKSKLLQVGYKDGTSFFEVYNVCMNLETKQLFYFNYELTQYASAVKLQSYPFGNELLNYDYEDMYNCSNQMLHVSRKGCCFFGMQIVSPQDVAPGLQKATYLNINVVPQWNFCGNNLNFDEVNKRIRKLAKSIKHSLQVFSGVFRQSNFFVKDNKSLHIYAPQYLWKVVQIHKTDRALAIITLNIPDLTADDVRPLVFCEDICEKTGWMRDSQWRNISRGYTFCCYPAKFAKQLGYSFEKLFQHYKLLVRMNIK